MTEKNFNIANVPNIVQSFTFPRLIRNQVIRAKWTPSTMQLDKITNNTSIFETKHTIEARSQTFEDENDSMFTEMSTIANTGYAYEKIFKAITQIAYHLKKSSDITLTSGSFYFKFN